MDRSLGDRCIGAGWSILRNTATQELAFGIGTAMASRYVKTEKRKYRRGRRVGRDGMQVSYVEFMSRLLKAKTARAIAAAHIGYSYAVGRWGGIRWICKIGDSRG